MNTILELNRDIRNLQKVPSLLKQVSSLRWNDTRVREVALYVRNSFNLLEQRWRNGLQNEFFVFCIPVYPVWDGPPVFLHDATDSDDSSQAKFERGRAELDDQVQKLLSKLKDRRSQLWRQQRQEAVDDSIREIEKLALQLFEIGEKGKATNADMFQGLMNWDERLQITMKDLGLSQRFSANFNDSEQSLEQRISLREECLNSYIDSLTNNPNEHLQQKEAVATISGNNNQNGTPIASPTVIPAAVRLSQFGIHIWKRIHGWTGAIIIGTIGSLIAAFIWKFWFHF